MKLEINKIQKTGSLILGLALIALTSASAQDRRHGGGGNGGNQNHGSRPAVNQGNRGGNRPQMAQHAPQTHVNRAPSQRPVVRNTTIIRNNTVQRQASYQRRNGFNSPNRGIGTNRVVANLASGLQVGHQHAVLMFVHQ
ncbi:MAG: hypothetical protein WDM90_19275 [Ferruginibacter sp.]